MGAYFDTLKMLMWAMIFMFLVVTPNMYIYSRGQGVKSDYMGVVTQFSLGNMGKLSLPPSLIFINYNILIGGSAAYCKQFPAMIDEVSFSCNTGVINATKYTPEVGIISSANS